MAGFPSAFPPKEQQNDQIPRPILVPPDSSHGHRRDGGHRDQRMFVQRACVDQFAYGRGLRDGHLGLTCHWRPYERQ